MYMKKALILGFAAVTFGFAAAQTQDPEPAKSGAKIVFTETSHNFGDVIEGQIARHEFKFTNSGTEPLVLQNVQASCGCTTPSYTSTPVMPGETGEVKASYGTEGRPGYFQKTVTVTFDNGVVTVLTIQGTVLTDTPAPKDSELK